MEVGAFSRDQKCSNGIALTKITIGTSWMRNESDEDVDVVGEDYVPQFRVE